ncbi:MAG: 5-carboxymethyl-2-hydroxymuconate Delta-isomerase [Pseudomonadota bacterium]
MPHLSFEYSANLAEAVDIDTLCAVLHAAAMDSGLFELGALRVRAHRCENYAVADQLPENAFLHLMISVGSGRDEAVLQAAGEVVWSALTRALADRFETPNFALTMEIREIDPRFSWKRNAIHPRIRAQQETGT